MQQLGIENLHFLQKCAQNGDFKNALCAHYSGDSVMWWNIKFRNLALEAFLFFLRYDLHILNTTYL